MKSLRIYYLALTIVFCAMPQLLFSQCIIRGYVKSGPAGVPMPGLNIMIQGTAMASITDLNGEYVFSNVPAERTVVILSSLVGYNNNSKTVYVETGKTYNVNFWDDAVTDADGNHYSAVEIGPMIWMGENLKTTRFNDGSEILNITDNVEWMNLNTSAYSWLNNDATTYKDIYGALYNWFSVKDSRKLCPSGWHVPSDAAWSAITLELGGDLVAGGKLKETGTVGWTAPNAGATNESGFSALPGGYRPSDFASVKTDGMWWSSTQYSPLSTPYGRHLSYVDPGFSSNNYSSRAGLSVRCLKDGFQTILKTSTVINITANSAVTGGEGIEDGGIETISKGVCWSLAHDPTITSNKAEPTSVNFSNGDFTCQINGLSPATTYYVRAYITTSLGTSYAPEISFKTGSEILADSLALVALYYSTNGSGWTNQTNWLVTNQPLGTWYGVTVSGDRVTELRLPINNLSGGIPAEIGDLSNIQVIDLSQNKLTGSIPQELFNLQFLNDLFLYQNQLTGTLPANMGNLAGIINMHLSQNDFTGTIPVSIGNLSTMQVLNISGNRLSGNLPTEVFNCQNLIGLGLSENEFSGQIPAEVGNLIHLSDLLLGRNNLEGSIPGSIGNLTNLRDLELNQNILSGTIPSELWNLSNLEVIDLSVNQLSGSIPADIGKLSKLQSLYLTDNQLSGSIPPEITSLTKLIRIGISKNQLSGSIPPGIGDLPDLYMLELYQNQLSGPVPSEITKLRKLQWLFLADNHFTGFPKLSGIMPAPGVLQLHGNHLDFDDIEPNIGLASAFTYSPQADKEITGERVVYLNRELKLSVDGGGTSSVYQWYKDGSPAGDPSPNNTFVVSSAGLSDAGTYSCRITNTIATALTLQSQAAIIEVKAPPTTVTNTDDSGYGSLRDAITYANSNPGPDTIRFNLSGAGPFTIKPLTTLPAFAESVFIDGFSQSGESLDPVIVIDGSDLPLYSNHTGFIISGTGGSSTIRGLALNRLRTGIQIFSDGNSIYGNFIGTDQDGNVDISNTMSDGVELQNSSGNKIGGNSLKEKNLISVSGRLSNCIHITSGSSNIISGNYIGVDKTGHYGLGEPYHGIFIENSDNNRIGGSEPGERNIVSNCFWGIWLDLSDYNIIQGNYVGTDSDGKLPLGNERAIVLSQSSYNSIGGIIKGQGNLISGNLMGVGIGSLDPEDFTECSHNTVQGNLIGTDDTGAGSVGNTGIGVVLQERAYDNKIGGSETGASNIIANSLKYGVWVAGADRAADPLRNTISQNSIFNNGRIGIDLSPSFEYSGVTPNDAGDMDAGPNGFQNFPVLSDIRLDLGNRTVFISGYLESVPSKEYTIEFFANKISHSSGYGEGQTYLGSLKISTDATGKAGFSTTLPIQSSWGDVISATATDQDGNTSEFSANVGGFTSQKVMTWPFYYKINSYGVPRITNGSDITAIDSAFRSWNSIANAAIDFRNGGLVENKYASATDGINLVTFTDDQFPFAPGVLAVAAKTLELLPGSSEARILDADIVVNPEFARNMIGICSGSSGEYMFDIQSLITHETGHVLGLLHSGISTSSMFYRLEPGISVRSLEQDDRSWAGYRYPSAVYGAVYGSISGNIRYGYDLSQPVAGALIIAADTRTNEKIHGYSDASGDYIIPGLRQDSYRIHIAPLDGSDAVYNLKPGNICSYLYSNTIYTDYPGEFLSIPESDTDDDSNISQVPVTAGTASIGINLITNRDITGPSLISVIPANGATAIGVKEDFLVTFSEPVNMNSFGETSCYLESAGVRVPVGYTAVSYTNSIVISPEAPLGYGTLYNLHLTPGIKDLKNNPLNVPEEGKTISFTTAEADLVPPVITCIIPLSGSENIFVTSGITVIFSEPMNRSSAESNFLMAPETFDASVPGKTEGSFTWDQDNTTFTFRPLGSLKEGTWYKIVINSEASDLGGVAMGETRSYTFRTVASAEPVIIDYGPSDGKREVAVTTCVFVDFSEPIDIAKVNENTFSVSTQGINVKGSYEFLNENSRIVFRPEPELSFLTPYTVTLTKGITDASDPASEFAGSIFSFTTAARDKIPHILYIDPPAAAIGSVITIAGDGFDPVPANNKLSFNGIIAGVKSATLTGIVAEVPPGALSGSVTVTSANAASDNSMFFYVVPQSFDPCENVIANVSSGTSTKSVAVNGDASYAFITNPGENTVSVIYLNPKDPLHPSFVRKVDVGNTPLKIDVNPQGTRAYVTNFNSNTVSVIDISDPANASVIKTINVGITPYGIAVTPDGMGVYVSNYLTNNLSLIDADPLSGGFDHVVANISTGTKPTNVAVTSDAGIVVVIDESGLTIINSDPSDPGFNSVIANVPTGTKPTDVAVRGDASMAIVSTEDGRLLLINLRPENEDYTDAIVANTQAGSKISGVNVSGDAMFVYATATEINKILVYRIVSGGIPSGNGSYTGNFGLLFHDDIDAGMVPEGLAISSDATRLFVLSDYIPGGERELVSVKLCCGPVDPASSIGDLIVTIQNLIANETIRDGNGRELITILNGALTDLSANRAKDAVNRLNTYIAKVKDLVKSKRLSAAYGQLLIDPANAIINQLKGTKSGPGESDTSEMLLIDDEVSNSSGLMVIYPNPFSDILTIKFEIRDNTEPVRVLLRVYNSEGFLIKNIIDEKLASGKYSFEWKGDNGNGMRIPTGSYLIFLKAGTTESVKTVILQR